MVTTGRLYEGTEGAGAGAGPGVAPPMTSDGTCHERPSTSVSTVTLDIAASGGGEFSFSHAAQSFRADEATLRRCHKRTRQSSSRLSPRQIDSCLQSVDDAPEQFLLRVRVCVVLPAESHDTVHVDAPAVVSREEDVRV
jgi:hypothetical protein